MKTPASGCKNPISFRHPEKRDIQPAQSKPQPVVKGIPRIMGIRYAQIFQIIERILNAQIV